MSLGKKFTASASSPSSSDNSSLEKLEFFTTTTTSTTTSTSPSSSSVGFAAIEAPHLGFFFGLKPDDDTDTLTIYEYRFSSYFIVCFFWAIVGIFCGLHWKLGLLNAAKVIFSFVVSNLCFGGYISLETKAMITNHYLAISLTIWCIYTGGLESVYIINFIFHPMQVGFQWRYTRPFFVLLLFISLLQFYSLIPTPLHINDEILWNMYAILGFVLYVLYFAKRIRLYADRFKYSYHTHPTIVIQADGDIRVLSNDNINYASLFVVFGIVWTLIWVFFNRNVITTLVNVTYLISVIFILYRFYLQKIGEQSMKKLTFLALMMLFSTYCLFAGGTNSPFFFMMISVACFYHDRIWNLQISFCLFFLIYLSGFVLPKDFQSKISPAEITLVYQLNFATVICFLSAIYWLTSKGEESPDSQSSRRISPFRAISPRKKVMIGNELLVIKRDSKLGEGSFGIVYEGEFRSKRVAVKVVNVSPRKKQREINFFREEDIDSKNIVKCYACQADPLHPKKHYLVMEYCAYDLERYLRDNKNYNNISLAFCNSVIKDALNGLQYLHGKNILHRDFKSANILLSQRPTEDGSLKFVAKLTDFDTSITQSGGTYTLESLSKLRGTLFYVAPEIFGVEDDENRDSIMDRCATVYSDTYSFGIVLWELFNSYAEKQYNFPYPALCYGKNYQIFKHVGMGFRPTVSIGFPTEYLKLYISCVQAKPRERPEISRIIEKVKKYTQLCEANKMKFTEEVIKVTVDATAGFRDFVKGS